MSQDKPPSAPPHRHQTPSAREVAERAGVSLTTVSRVLRGKSADTIPESTRKRVIEVANAVGYRPNGLALALRRGVTETIGLVVPDISDSHFHRIARGVEDMAQRAGHSVLFTNTERVAERQIHAVNMLLDRRVDGIILAGGGINHDAHLADIAWGKTRVVGIGPHGLDIPTVRIDSRSAIADAVGHLAQLGRRRVLCLAARPEWLTSSERLAGYRQAVAAYDLVDDPSLIMHGTFGREDAERRVRDAVAAGTRFDAIVAFNDYCAFGALRALSSLGLRVPEDVPVIGCGDVPESDLLELSSVNFSQYNMGITAARLVLGEKLDLSTTIQPYSLTIRSSTRLPAGQTGPPPAAAGLSAAAKPVAALAADRDPPEPPPLDREPRRTGAT